MPRDIPLKCTCGKLRGVVHHAGPGHGMRLACYCDDCQSFAHALARAGDILDPHGGTDIYQTTPARFELTHGLDHLACLRLTPRGLLRWYARCCRTPIGNTLATRQLPFIGIVHLFMDHDGDGRSRDEALGPVRVGVHGRFALGDRATVEAHDRAPGWLVLRTLRMLLTARLRGEHRRSVLFDPRGQPVVTPHLVGEEPAG